MHGEIRTNFYVLEGQLSEHKTNRGKLNFTQYLTFTNQAFACVIRGVIWEGFSLYFIVERSISFALLHYPTGLTIRATFSSNQK